MNLGRSVFSQLASHLPDLAAMGKPSGYARAFEKVHPGMDFSWAIKRAAKAPTVMHLYFSHVIAVAEAE